MTETATPPDAETEVLIVTDAARATVFEIRANEDDADSLGLRVEVTGLPENPVWVGQQVSLNVKVLLTERGAILTVGRPRSRHPSLR